jgi:hypothetical protein
MKISGPLVVDLSLWNDHINPQELIDGGVVSAILGLYQQWEAPKYILNTNCQRILNQLKGTSLIIQSYYYYYPEKDPIAEANWFINTMVSSGADFKFAWVDCEDHDYPMDEHARSEKFRIFTEQVARSLPPNRVGVYTNKAFIDSYAPRMNDWIGKYPAWVAEYGKESPTVIEISWEQLKSQWLPDYDIILSPAQTNPVGHQFTGDIYKLPGVYNYANYRMTLDVSEFTSVFINSLGGNVPIPTPIPVPPTPPPTPIPGPTDNKYYVNTTFNINIRSGPAETFPVVGYLKPKDTVVVYGTPVGKYSKIGVTNVWVYTDFLTKSTGNTTVYYWSANRLNIRFGPSQNTAQVGYLEPYTKVSLVGDVQNGYAPIGVNQWVFFSLLVRIN